MAIGYLTVQARTANESIPLANVQVRILDDQGNTVYVLTTDESGETQTVPLETLDKRFSQNPYYTGIPYVSYNVLAQAAGLAALEEKAYSKTLRALIREERPFLAEGLAALGCQVFPGEANYLL